MSWTLNQLEKTVEKTYIPGTPGVPGVPGRPATPAYTYTVTETVGGGEKISNLEPIWEQYIDLGEGTGIGSRGYRIFDGRRATFSGVIGGQEGIPPLYVYIYDSTTVTRTITVPAVPAVPPIPGTPVTPGQIEVDFLLGWDAGAVGPILSRYDAVRWRFHPGSVGAAVGVTRSSMTQGQTYREMRLAVLAMSGTYSVVVNGASVTSPRAFSEDQLFYIAQVDGEGGGEGGGSGNVAVVVNGAVVHEVPVNNSDLIIDSSLYSGYDLILDAEYLEDGTSEMLINAYLGASSPSAASASPVVVPTFGPGTHRGQVGASSKSKAIAGSALVNGTVVTWGSASSVSASASAPTGGVIVTPTFGPGTHRGQVSSSTKSIADVERAPSVGDVVIDDPTGDNSGDSAEIRLTGNFPAGSTITVTYTTDGGGTSTVVYTVPTDSTAEQAANGLAVVLDGRSDITVVSTGGGVITVTPSGGSTTVTIDEVVVVTYPGNGDGIIDDPTGTTVDPANIQLTGNFPAGSTITVIYTTNGSGTSTVVYTVLTDLTAEQAANVLAVILNAQLDIVAVSTGGGHITVSPEGASTTVTIDEVIVSVYPGSGVGGGTGIMNASGSADLAMEPVIGAGSAPDVYVAWTGYFAGASIPMAPLEVSSENADIIPYTALGALVMVPVTVDSYGLTGENSVSSLGTLHFLIAKGSEGEYSDAELAMLPAYSYGSTGEIELAIAELSFRFVLYAAGLERDQNGAILVARNRFDVAGFGGGQIRAAATLALEASGSGEGVGEMVGVIGYA